MLPRLSSITSDSVPLVRSHAENGHIGVGGEEHGKTRSALSDLHFVDVIQCKNEDRLFEIRRGNCKTKHTPESHCVVHSDNEAGWFAHSCQRRSSSHRHLSGSPATGTEQASP
jgi:hypothetical protein